MNQKSVQMNYPFFAELGCKIGVLSGSRSIIGSLAFAKSEVLAQYMKDIT